MYPAATMWVTARARFAAFFRRLFRARPRPGYFVGGHKLAMAGLLRAAPWVWPARKYLVYVPRGFSRWTRSPLLVLLHGCKQTPEEFAAATRITALADEHGWLVLLPRQTAKANPWSCWNWFDGATAAGQGETAIVAAQARTVRRRFRADPRRVFVAGLSAGGALAAALGARHPQLFAGVFVHSGLACGAASTASAALRVMSQGADTDTRLIGERARAAGGDLRLPLLALHGLRDSVVAPINAYQLVRQYLALNGRLVAQSPAGEPPAADAESTVSLADGRTVHTMEYQAHGRMLVRLVRVDGLGHAWSGGDAAYAFNDPGPPDATAMLAEFVGSVGRQRS